MAVDNELLELIVCPDSREKLRIADAEVIDKVNAAIRVGKARSRSGQVVEAPLDAGLIRADGRVLYPVYNDIPNLLPGDGIPLDAL